MNDTGHIAIRPVRSDVEAQEARTLLARHVIRPWAHLPPERAGHDDGALRPTLIGAWAHDELVGAAFVDTAYGLADELIRAVGPAMDVVDAVETHHAVAQHIAVVEGIATSPQHRREGIGLQVKLFCDAWAAQHQAVLALSIPTNEAARRLNEKAGHTVVAPFHALAVQVLDDQGIPRHPAYCALRPQGQGPSMWAFKTIEENQRPRIRIGVCRPDRPGPLTQGNATIDWAARATPGGAI